MAKVTEITGEIFGPSRLNYVEWKIEEYFSLSPKVDSYIKSPCFHFSNGTWYLMIYTNGNRKDNSVGWLSFYLGREDLSSEKVSMDYSLGILGRDGQVYKEETFFFNFENGSLMYGQGKFIDTNKLRNKRRVAVPKGTLTVFCKAEISSYVAEVASQTVFHDGFDALIRDFRNLLHSEKTSDVTFNVKGSSFHAHKLVLGTRTSMFSDKFEHSIKENNIGEMDIEDCEPDTFRDFLSFVYTGNIEKLSWDNATGLFSLADKYDMNDLKSLCMNFMKDNISLDVACEVLAVATRHNATELKKSAEELISKNIKQLIPTKQWIMFMGDNPILASYLLMTVIPD